MNCPAKASFHSLYRKSFPRKGDHHTHRYEYLTIPNFRLYNQRSIINWSMKKTSQSVYPLPDISPKPQPALDRVESKNGKFSNVNSIFHPGNSTMKIWKPLKNRLFWVQQKKSKGIPEVSFHLWKISVYSKRDHSFLKTWIFAWDFCWEEIPFRNKFRASILGVMFFCWEVHTSPRSLTCLGSPDLAHPHPSGNLWLEPGQLHGRFPPRFDGYDVVFSYQLKKYTSSCSMSWICVCFCWCFLLNNYMKLL